MQIKMDFLTMIVIAFSVCIDNFATSLAYGLQAKKNKGLVLLQVICIFSLVQLGLAGLGWAVGIGLSQWIGPFDHWIAFGLLSFLGLKLLKEAREELKEKEQTDLQDQSESISKKSNNNLKFATMFVVALVTSTDSLAVGLTYALLEVNILVAISLIGVVTATISTLGFSLGNRLSEKLENRMDYVAGVVLIGLGVKILLEHLLL